jgi:hypothetical protein
MPYCVGQGFDPAEQAARMKVMVIVFLLASIALHAADDWVARAGGVTVKDANGDVVELSLRSSWITDGDLARVTGFPRLRKLDLAYTHINDQALEPLKDLHHLLDLDLTYAEHITDGGLARLRPVRSLQHLNLEGTRVSDSGMTSLAALANLRSLSLRSTLITDSALDQLEPLAGLEQLSIGANRIAGFGLAYLQALPRLKHLDLSGVQLTDDGIWSVSLTDLSIESIAALKDLESLNVAAAELSGVAAIPDGGIRESVTIRITDLGIEKLGGLRKLRRLDIARAQVTARGLRRLADLPVLEHLGLAYTGALDSAAVSILAGMKPLRFVDLSGVAILEDAKQSLAANGELRVAGLRR